MVGVVIEEVQVNVKGEVEVNDVRVMTMMVEVNGRVNMKVKGMVMIKKTVIVVEEEEVTVIVVLEVIM